MLDVQQLCAMYGQVPNMSFSKASTYILSIWVTQKPTSGMLMLVAVTPLVSTIAHKIRVALAKQGTRSPGQLQL